MHTINHALEKKIVEADGRYLDPPALLQFEQYVQSYAMRVETYQTLREQESALILQALRKLAHTHPELVQQHGPRCRFDMSEVVRYMALSVLRDDEMFFKEQVLSWLETILLAHKKQNHCTLAYRYLQESIDAHLPAAQKALIQPYVQTVITTLNSHA